MARQLELLSGSPETAYRRNRTTFRTDFMPLGLRDPQQAQPQFWCMLCGAEVYRPDTLLCRRCEKEHDGT